MIFAVIPARGGSKRLPRKNLREIGGKTLVAWAIESARAATRLDEIVVSTDDNAIVQEAARLRCAWILRPEYLAQDETPTLPVLLHAVQFYPASTVIVTLQPTVPFRLGIEIDEAIEALDRFEADSTVTVAHGHPNGSVYTTRRACLDAGRIMGPRCVDLVGPAHINIDNEHDLVRAERHYAAYLRDR